MNIKKLEEILDDKVTSIENLGGGCISDTKKISVVSGQKFTVKLYSKDMGIKEANGLKELEISGAIRVPRVLFADKSMLVMEYIAQGNKAGFFFEVFGKQLAALHRHQSEFFGFYEDNFIGTNPQINLPQSSDWISFYFENRLLYQYKLAEKNGYVDNNFKNLFSKIEKRLHSILNGSQEAPSLIHGDLWGGNYIVGLNGEPVLIDPAVYYGHREAELAMTKLFGGFSELFYTSYDDTFPLLQGHEYRQGIYTLYHVLNHLNIFGQGYKPEAISLMKQYQ